MNIQKIRLSPTSRGAGISAHVIWGKYEKGEKRREKAKEKGRKRSDIVCKKMSQKKEK
jgi:hypothetical protein